MNGLKKSVKIGEANGMPSPAHLAHTGHENGKCGFCGRFSVQPIYSHLALGGRGNELKGW